MTKDNGTGSAGFSHEHKTVAVCTLTTTPAFWLVDPHVIANGSKKKT